MTAADRFRTQDRLADVLGIDLSEAALTKLDEVATRYPIVAARGSAKSAR